MVPTMRTLAGGLLAAPMVALLVSAVANAGFRAAVTVQPGLVKAGINRLLLPRYEVTAADFGRFPLRLQEMFADCSAAPSGIG